MPNLSDAQNKPIELRDKQGIRYTPFHASIAEKKSEYETGERAVYII